MAINPKPIERQHVSLCLQVFCDEALNALKTHPEVNHEQVEGTISFLSIFIRVWKIINVRSQFMDIRLKDSWRAVVNDTSD